MVELIAASLVVIDPVDVAADQLVVVLDVVRLREPGDILRYPRDVAVDIVAVVRARAFIGRDRTDAVAEVLLRGAIEVGTACRFRVGDVGPLASGCREVGVVGCREVRDAAEVLAALAGLYSAAKAVVANVGVAATIELALILREAEATPIVVVILDGIAIGGADEERLPEGVVAILGDERVGRMALAVGAGDDSLGGDGPDEVAGAIEVVEGEVIVAYRVLENEYIVETIGVGTDGEIMLFEATDVVVDALTDLAIDGGADAPGDGSLRESTEADQEIGIDPEDQILNESSTSYFLSPRSLSVE